MPYTQRKVVLILDDFSFMITGRSQKDRERLYNLFRIRHILGEDKTYYVIFVAHYLRSLAPTLRASYVKILTSVDIAETKIYYSEAMFSQSTLLTYYEYLQQYGTQNIILVNKGDERIINITLPHVGKLTQRKRIEKIGEWSLLKYKYSKRKALMFFKRNISSESENYANDGNKAST